MNFISFAWSRRYIVVLRLCPGTVFAASLLHSISFLKEVSLQIERASPRTARRICFIFIVWLRVNANLWKIIFNKKQRHQFSKVPIIIDLHHGLGSITSICLISWFDYENFMKMCVYPCTVKYGMFCIRCLCVFVSSWICHVLCVWIRCGRWITVPLRGSPIFRSRWTLWTWTTTLRSCRALAGTTSASARSESP